MNYFALLCMILGLAGLLASGWLYATHSQQSGWVTLPVRVVAIEKRDVRINRDQLKRYYHPIVRPVVEEGQTLPDDPGILTLENGSQLQSGFYVGHQFDVLYTEGNPEQARLTTLMDGPLVALALAAFSALMIGVGLQVKSRQPRATA